MKPISRIQTALLFATATLAIANLHAAPTGTAFTYQGRLASGGSAANGLYDFQFTVYDALSNGSAKGGPLTTASTGVTNGVFTATLDFGGGVFDGTALWLEIGTRTNGAASFTPLAPRQALTAAPYANYAPSAGTAAALAGPLLSSQLAGLYSSGVNFNHPSNLFSGTLYGRTYGDVFGNVYGNVAGNLYGSCFGDGGGLFNLNASQLSGGMVPDDRLGPNVQRTGQAWLLNGNTGAPSGANSLGTTDNQPMEIKVAGQRAMRFEPNTNGPPNVIGGWSNNVVGSAVGGAVIGGGGATSYGGIAYTNTVSSSFGVVGGGLGNFIDAYADASTIAGGRDNAILTNSGHAAIGGGLRNKIQPGAYEATIGGGLGNWVQTNSPYATIGGGYGNIIQTNSSYATVSGGDLNTNSGRYAVIPGGFRNVASGNYALAAGQRAKATNQGAFVWSDSQTWDFSSTANDQFSVRASGGVRLETGGAGLTLDGQPVLTSSGAGFWRVGGNTGTVPGANYLGTADYQPLTLAVSGQPALNLGVNGSMGMGTCTNTGSYSIALGNSTTASDYAAVALGNLTKANAYNATAMGGSTAATNYYSTAMGSFTISGGDSATAMGYYSKALGDYALAVGQGNTASGSGSVAMGGWNAATNAYSTAMGAGTLAGGYASTALGSGTIASGVASLAAGAGTKASHDNCFVWNGGGGSMSSTAPNQFLILAYGGVGINKNNPASALDVAGTVTATTFNPTSDRNVKQQFASIQPQEVLDKLAALPISEWSFKSDPSIRHVGPMAQDFYGAFGLGIDDKHIATVDADGVALAAIQGLNQKLEEKSAEIQALKRENQALAERLTSLEQMVKSVATRN